MLVFTAALLLGAASVQTLDATPVPQATPAPAPAPKLAPAKPAPAAPKRPAAPQDDIVVVGRTGTPAGDPLQAVNAESFAATQAVDTAVVGPAARAYKSAIPRPVRSGIHNFLYNLREPVVFVNYLLQFKPGKAAETAGRFLVNSTVGVAGLVDVAKRKPFHLPRRSNGFANTLGYHGVKNGPFLFLPLVGPTTVRDLVGGALDRLILPVVFGKTFTRPSYAIPAAVLGALDHRAEFDEQLKVLHDGTVDPYTASREFYLQRRQAEIDHLHGRPTGLPGGGPPNRDAPAVPYLPVMPGDRAAQDGPTPDTSPADAATSQVPAIEPATENAPEVAPASLPPEPTPDRAEGEDLISIPESDSTPPR